MVCRPGRLAGFITLFCSFSLYQPGSQRFHGNTRERTSSARLPRLEDSHNQHRKLCCIYAYFQGCAARRRLAIQDFTKFIGEKILHGPPATLAGSQVENILTAPLISPVFFRLSAAGIPCYLPVIRAAGGCQPGKTISLCTSFPQLAQPGRFSLANSSKYSRPG